MYVIMYMYIYIVFIFRQGYLHTRFIKLIFRLLCPKQSTILHEHISIHVPDNHSTLLQAMCRIITPHFCSPCAGSLHPTDDHMLDNNSTLLQAMCWMCYITPLLQATCCVPDVIYEYHSTLLQTMCRMCYINPPYYRACVGFAISLHPTAGNFFGCAISLYPTAGHVPDLLYHSTLLHAMCRMYCSPPPYCRPCGGCA